MTRIIYSFNRAGGGGLAPTFWGGKLYITLTEYLFIFFIFFYKSSPPPQSTLNLLPTPLHPGD